MSETRYYTPQEAEAAFYASFQRKDLAGMMAVWAEGDDIVCVHPGGRMLIGADAVRAGWDDIFRRGPAMQFIVDERRRAEDGGLALHIVHEHIRVGGEMAPAPVLATNAYRRTAHGWRMILHHASPGPAAARPAGTVH